MDYDDEYFDQQSTGSFDHHDDDSGSEIDSMND